MVPLLIDKILDFFFPVSGTQSQAAEQPLADDSERHNHRLMRQYSNAAKVKAPQQPDQ